MKNLKKYLNSRKVTIEFLLDRPKRSFTPGTFHKLRIELKKLNAFLDLVNFCAKDFRKKKIFNPFKQVFNQAGKVRELQIQEAMLKKYFPHNSIPEYKALLRKTRLKERRTFLSMIDTKMINRLRNRFNEIDSFLSKIKSTKAACYLNNEINETKNLIQQNPLQKDQLHELRKRLKTINYNRRILALKGYYNKISKKNGLQHLLGQWHDLQVMIDHLNKRMNGVGINPNEVILLEILKTKISAERDLLFGQIREAVCSSELYESGK